MKSHNVTLSPFILTAFILSVSEWYLLRMLLLLLLLPAAFLCFFFVFFILDCR